MRYSLLMFFAVQCGFINPAVAHPFHSTLAEMEWNAKSHVFEVSLQFAGVEIEEELSSLQGRHIDLEATPDAERLLRDYITLHFKISDASHNSCRIRWVGMELQVQYVWAYFEVELTSDADPAVNAGVRPIVLGENTAAEPTGDSTDFLDLSVRCTLLTEFRPDHVNLVNIQTLKATASVHLTKEQPESVVRFQARRQRR